MKQTYYCIFDRDGTPIYDTVRYLRRESIASMSIAFYDWKTLRSYGYTREKVTINKVKP